jgi:hypothetical protein
LACCTLLLMVVAAKAGQTRSHEDLIGLLRQGGYVLVMRQASSPREAPTKPQANPDAIRYDIGLSSWERRACLVASTRVASYRRARTRDAQLFGQSRTLRIKQLLGLACSMANLDLAAPSAAILHKQRFSFFSRASGPSCNQLRKSSGAGDRSRRCYGSLEHPLH